MAEKIEELVKTHHIAEYEKLKKELPIDLEALTSVEGVGPKTAKILYDKLKIKTLNDLESAARKGKIRNLPGMGKKTEENIIQALVFLRQTDGRMLLGNALPHAFEFIEQLKNIKGVDRVSEAGSLRRRQETIGDIDILIASREPKKILERVASLPGVQKVWGKGETKASVHLKHGFDMDVRVVPPKSYGAALQYFTGSKAHNIKLRKIAIDRGYKLNEYGLYKIQNAKIKSQNDKSEFKNKEIQIAGRTEEELYEKLGLRCIEPEMREDLGEIELAMKGPAELPNLIEYGSLRGDLQIQTNWTDGRHSIEQMAEAAKKMGLEYILITDHSKSLTVTGGLTDKKILQQKKEIEKVNKKIRGITILSGAEVDILKDGSLDLEEETLKQLDIVGVSVHSHFRLSRKEQTARIIKAMRNPNVDIFFHPTARRINRRAAIDLDIDKVIAEAKKTRTILEINAHPERLDLKDEYIRQAKIAGCKFSINSDAHSVGGLAVLNYGIAQARRGWLEAKDVINTRPLDKMLKMLK
jgi:DNA polymerase (family 10)